MCWLSLLLLLLASPLQVTRCLKKLSHMSPKAIQNILTQCSYPIRNMHAAAAAAAAAGDQMSQEVVPHEPQINPEEIQLPKPQHGGCAAPARK
jgi:hypothetical protein